MIESASSSDSNGDQPAADVVVPDDFPRDPFPAALSGSQPKFAARLIDGKYVVGLTKEERVERYLMCLDLVSQLTDYVNRKRTQKPDLTLAQILDNVISRIPHQGWDLGSVEVDWIAKQMRSRL